MCFLKMEKEFNITAVNEEFITVEVEFESIPSHEEPKCIAMEEELISTAVEEESKPSCPVCDKIFVNARTCKNHLYRIHNVPPSRPSTTRNKNIVCPVSNCREKFFVLSALRQHIVQTHEIDLEVEEKIFPSYKEFCQWKEIMERETKSHYVKKRSSNLSKGKDKLKDQFVCHRSGFYRPNGFGKRRGRRVGSKKIGAFCPSTIVVSHSKVNTYVKVEHWRKHLGHVCDMRHLCLTRSEKLEIVDKINKGMTFTQILECYKKDSDSGQELHRINYLSRRDLSNIVEQFNIKRNRIAHSNDDLVDLWVKNMEKFGNDSPVAFFKKQGMKNELLNCEDFMIVIMTKYQKEMGIKYSGKNMCIDCIHSVSSRGFSLTALLTIDELSAVFPLAFCISSKTDEVSMIVFFESVKRLIGTIETPVFVSNDDSAFYDAWIKTMGPASFQLLCNWHVLSCWHRDLDKISDKDKRESVYKTLTMLLEESDVFEFESSINSFVTELEENASTREFAEYFCENYLPRVKMWAFCYMRHLGISTFDHLEAMHTSLKKLFLDVGEDNVYNSQVNIAIPALLKLSHDELLGRSDELLGCLPVDWIGWIDRIRKGHRQGLNVCDVVAIDSNSWSVKLHRRVDGHVVTGNATCSPEACYLRCLRCNICIHSFYCTCFDNLVNVNICGHMHACARFINGPEPVEDNVARRKKKINEIVTDEKEITVVGNEVNETPVIGNEEVNETPVIGNKEVNETPVIGNKEVNKTPIQHVVPSSSKTLLTKQLNTIKTVMECTEFTEEHSSQLKNSFDAIISFMIMHGKSKKPLIQVPYAPSKNYRSTVNKKPAIQYQNQMISTVKNKPKNHYQNQMVSILKKKPENQSQNQLISILKKKPEDQIQNQIITIGPPVCLIPVKNLKQT